MVPWETLLLGMVCKGDATPGGNSLHKRWEPGVEESVNVKTGSNNGAESFWLIGSGNAGSVSGSCAGRFYLLLGSLYFGICLVSARM